MTFSPDRLVISNITQGIPAIVTTTEDHNMSTGQIVRMHVPNGYGMTQLNQLLLSITVIASDSFSLQYSQCPIVNVDSRFYEAFVNPGFTQFTAEVLPVGYGPTPITSPEVYSRNGVCESKVEDAVYNNSISEIPF